MYNYYTLFYFSIGLDREQVQVNSRKRFLPVHDTIWKAETKSSDDEDPENDTGAIYNGNGNEFLPSYQVNVLGLYKNWEEKHKVSILILGMVNSIFWR